MEPIDMTRREKKRPFDQSFYGFDPSMATDSEDEDDSKYVKQPRVIPRPVEPVTLEQLKDVFRRGYNVKLNGRVYTFTPTVNEDVDVDAYNRKLDEFTRYVMDVNMRGGSKWKKMTTYRRICPPKATVKILNKKYIFGKKSCKLA